MVKRLRSMRNDGPRELHLAIKCSGGCEHMRPGLIFIETELKKQHIWASNYMMQYYGFGKRDFPRYKATYGRVINQIATFRAYPHESFRYWLNHDGFRYDYVVQPEVPSWFLKNNTPPEPISYFDIDSLNTQTFELWQKKTNKLICHKLAIQRYIFDSHVAFLADHDRGQLWDSWYRDNQDIFRNMILLKQKAARNILKHEYSIQCEMALKSKGFQLSLIERLCQAVFGKLLPYVTTITPQQIQDTKLFIEDNLKDFREVVIMRTDYKRKDYVGAVWNQILKCYFDVKLVTKKVNLPPIRSLTKEEFHRIFQDLPADFHDSRDNRREYATRWKRERSGFLEPEFLHIPSRFWETSKCNYVLVPSQNNSQSWK